MAVSIGGSTLLVLVIVIVYTSRKSEDEKEAQLKVDKFLEDYKTLNPVRYSYSDLKKIIGKFKQRLGQGGYGNVSRGKFSNGIPIAVKMFCWLHCYGTFLKEFRDVFYKSDVFSYGMMLEMVGCRKKIDFTHENQSQIYFPEWIYNKLIQGRELNLEFVEDEDEEIDKKLAIVGLWCIQWNPIEGPSMPKVLQMLEGDLQSLEMPPKPFVSSNIEIGAD